MLFWTFKQMTQNVSQPIMCARTVVKDAIVQNEMHKQDNVSK